ncbi:hypothetical protein [Aegicerativicinus sediminis]
MVEIFKTNISKKKEANSILEKLSFCFPNYRMNFDLEDCDNILRVEYRTVETHAVKVAVESWGYRCIPFD